MKDRAVSRSRPSGDAVYCAAYRGARRLWNERTGDLYKYEGRQDVRDVRIVLPTRWTTDPAMAWARDPYRLWNAAEFSEVNRNARVAREYMVILPEEMTFRQRRDVVYGFAQALTDRYGNAIDVALHDRRPGRARHYHAHLLATTRKLGPDGLLQKTRAEGYGEGRLHHGGYEESIHARQLWERSLRQAIHEAGLPSGLYERLHREYGQAESTWEKRVRLRREGFDLNRQQREDRRRTRLTLEERVISAQKKRDIAKFSELQRRTRAERQTARQREKREGLTPAPHERRLRCWLPRWDVREGLLKPWEVESQLRRVGQTPGMVPWEALEHPGTEPAFDPPPVPQVERAVPSHSGGTDAAEMSLTHSPVRAFDHAMRKEARQQALSWLSRRQTLENSSMETAEQVLEPSYGLEFD